MRIGSLPSRFLRIFGLLVLLSYLALSAYVAFHRLLLPALDARVEALKDYRPPTACRLTDRYGHSIDTVYEVRRTYVPLEQISPYMIQALLSAEDRRFFDHQGYDALGIVRALVTNLRSGSLKQGGSTLTQQLVKHLVVGNEHSFRRKLEEALIAWRLERKKSKDELLELYLNYVYLGSGNYGVEAAARDYFGKSARALSIDEAALLAGLLPAPSVRSPREDPEQAIAGRNRVLRAMAQQKYVTSAEAEALCYGNVHPPPRAGDPGFHLAGYRTELRREVARTVGWQPLFTAGLQVISAMDPLIQTAAEQAVRSAAEAVELRQGHGGPVDALTPEGWELFFAIAPELERNHETGEVLPPKAGSCFPAAFIHDKEPIFHAGPLSLPIPEAVWQQKIRALQPETPSLPLSEVARAGQVWRICLNATGELELAPHRWVEGAAVVLSQENGEVLAMVGGLEMRIEEFNRATQAFRQPGSVFKLFVLAAALESGVKLTDSILDAPFPVHGGRHSWQPHNYGDTYRGRISVSDAFAFSSNTAMVRLAERAGISRVREMAHRLGVSSPLPNDLTLALGTGEASLLEITLAFASVANGGYALRPIYIQALRDGDGKLRAEAGGAVLVEGSSRATLPGGRGEKVLSDDLASALKTALIRVVEKGTARGARIEGREFGGKTGTTSDFRDAWFIGFTKHHTIGIWLGCDVQTPLGLGEVGGKAALPAWKAIVEALDGPPVDTH